MYVLKRGCEIVDYFRVVQDREEWRALMFSEKSGKFTDVLDD